MIDASILIRQYQGSVKNVLFSKDDPDSLWFAFTDDYSVFDWGKMPDTIANKGKALALIGAHIFQALSKPSTWQNLRQSAHLRKFDAKYLEQRFNHSVFNSKTGLEKSGLPSHFLGLYKGIEQGGIWKKLEALPEAVDNKIIDKLNNSSEQLLMRVMAAKVNWPMQKSILGENLYFYPSPQNSDKCRLIPLEVVFRFGMVEGSSLQKKLEINPNYASLLGLRTTPKINEWFSQPTLEFFSKLEPKDRLLTWQEAVLLANLSPQQFERLIELALDTALALHVLFAECNLELWDGKLEFIFENTLPTSAKQSDHFPEGQILLADSVGPDELRLLYKGVHLSKEFLRQYYRPSDWAKSLSKAQSLAQEKGQEDWQKICCEQLKLSPSHLNPDMKRLADQLYGMIANQLYASSIFTNHPKPEDFIIAVNEVLARYSQEKINA